MAENCVLGVSLVATYVQKTGPRANGILLGFCDRSVHNCPMQENNHLWYTSLALLGVDGVYEIIT